MKSVPESIAKYRYRIATALGCALVGDQEIGPGVEIEIANKHKPRLLARGQSHRIGECDCARRALGGVQGDRGIPSVADCKIDILVTVQIPQPDDPRSDGAVQSNTRIERNRPGGRGITEYRYGTPPFIGSQ